MTGITISLDHWNDVAHNQFRGNDKSFYWVQEAVLNYHRVDLPTYLSLCATKEFVSRDNLWKYLRLAKCMGIAIKRMQSGLAVSNSN